jgi:hypothetical protein
MQWRGACTLLAGALSLACGSNAPEVPKELLASGSGCSATDYPSEGLGTEPGSVVSNACFVGYRAPDRIAYGLKGPGCRFLSPAKDKADVRMRNEPTRPVQHKSEAGLSHFDGRYHVPDQLEVDFSDHHADRRSAAGNRNRQVWLRASVVAHVTKPDPGRARAQYRGIGGSVSAALNSIEADT